MFDIKLIAHRGHGPTSLLSRNGNTVPSQFCPENTLKAFSEAVRQGADGIEFDLHVTKDGRVVIIHDDELNRNVEGAKRDGRELGRVSEKTLHEIKQFNVGQGEPIPTLEEALDYFVEANSERKRASLPALLINPELKGRNIADAAINAFQPYIDKGLLNPRDIVFCSFDHDCLAHIKSVNSAVQIAPCIRTKTLFGPENVIIPGWHVKEGVEYKNEGLEYLRDFHRAHKTAGFDPVLWDVYKPLIDMAKEEGVVLFASTSNLRSYDENHLVLLLAAAQEVGICFKTDEPAKARRALNRLVQNIEQATGVEQIMNAETIPEVAQSPVSNLKEFFLNARDMFDRVLCRPITHRPEPYKHDQAKSQSGSSLDF